MPAFRFEWKMRSYLYIISILFFLISCQSKTEIEVKDSKVDLPDKVVSRIESRIELNHQQEKIENLKKESQRKEPIKPKTKKLVKVVVDNTTQYSKKFISELSVMNGMDRIELDKGMIILNQTDSISFPEIPAIKHKKVFTGRKADLSITLTVERINFTSMEYRIEIVEFGKSKSNTKGIADLGTFFFLGSESDTDDLTRESYFSTEFANSVDSCYTNIRIGNFEDSNDKPLLAKIVKNCNGEVMNIGLNNFPSLREK